MDNHIKALTSTRGLAAMVVVCFHFGIEQVPFNIKGIEQFFTGASLLPSYFFVLSGFVMCITYFQRDTSAIEFMQRRAARIFPLYYFSILLTIAIPIYQKLWLAIPPEEHFTWKLLANLVFVQSFIPGWALSMNAPGWTLSCEVFFYALFPFILLFAKKNTKAFIWFAVVLYATSLATHLLMLEYIPDTSAKAHDVLYYNPILHLNSFVNGIAAGAIYLTSEKKLKAPTYLCAVLMLTLYYLRPVSAHNGALTPAFALFMIAAATKQPKFLQWPVLIFLGEISYGIYLLQEPIHKYFVAFNKAYLGLPIAGGVFYIYLALLLIASTLSFHFIEKPLRKFINSL
jgi:peptidoglycan/LPS O-acetylase OafA/YrhL